MEETAKKPGPKSAEQKALEAQQAEQAQREASKKRRERRRATVGEAEYKLSAPARPGFQRRWVNDAPGRIDRFVERGWDVVQDEKGQDRRFAGKIAENIVDGSAVLMEIPEEFFAEDQAAKMERVIDPATMKENLARKGGHDTPEEYIPGNQQAALRQDKLR